MFKDSPEGQTQYEPAALAGIEPVAKAASGFEQHETGYVTALAPMKFRDLLYSAATVERLVQERNALEEVVSNHVIGRAKEGLAHIRMQNDLAASQARNQQLREALSEIAWSNDMTWKNDRANAALHLPQDDTALRQWGAKLLRDMADLGHGDWWEALRRKADELETGK